MEAGYGDAPEDAAATASGVLEVGAVGLNLEDLSDAGDDLLPIEAYVAKIAAIRQVAADSGVPLVLNARTDVFLGAVGEPATRLERAIERGRAYLDAGADCIFVPGVTDPRLIGALVDALDGRVSVLAVPGSPSLTELATLGVSRISVGSGPYRAALALTRLIAEEAYGVGSLDAMVSGAGAIRRRPGPVRELIRPAETPVPKGDTGGRGGSIVRPGIDPGGEHVARHCTPIRRSDQPAGPCP